MDYPHDVEDFDGEFTPEMYYDDPDFEDVAEMLQSGWLSPEHGQMERLSLTEMFNNCVTPSVSQMFVMIIPLVMLSLMFKIICTLATEVPKSSKKKMRKNSNDQKYLNSDANGENGSSRNGKNGKSAQKDGNECTNTKNKNSLSKNGKSETYSSEHGQNSDNNASRKPNKTENLDQDFMTLSFIHVTSAMFGTLALYLFFHWNLIYLCVLSLLAYVVLLMTDKFVGKYYGPLVSLCIVSYIMICEFFLETTVWHQIRGAGMILAMKAISIGFDLDVGVIPFPEVQEFIGYTFNIGTVIFGPWISYQDYMCVELQHKYKMGLRWATKIVTSLVCSIVCLVVSTCVLQWMILDGSYKWIIAYRDAQSFRFSHYFVSYLSEVTVVCAGLGAVGFNGDTVWSMSVSRSHNIEFPRSLVDVVTNWNLPMHYWLKTYVFRAARPLGTFLAIILTYAASSVLHGLNFQLAAVLFSLGFYSYVEYVLRKKLAKIFNACIEAKKCKDDCTHEYKWTHPLVVTTNVCFGLLTIFHLAYLGLMFDSSDQAESGYTMAHTLRKWANLDFASHWVTLGCYLFYWLI